LVAATVLSLGVASPFGLPPARGATVRTFVVDDIRTGTNGTADRDTDDNICEAKSTSSCTLRAAIEQGNETSSNIEVVITVEKNLRAGMDMPITSASDAYMTTSSVGSGNSGGAYFHIKRAMTIDLGNNLWVYPSGTMTSETRPAAAFYVNAKGVKLENFTDIYSTGTSIVFGPDSDGSSLTGGSLKDPPNTYQNGAIRVRPGANNITIKDVTLGSMPKPAADTGAGMIRLASESGSAPIENLTISDVVFDNTLPSGKTCTAASTEGCPDGGIAASAGSGLTRGPKLVNLKILNSTFKNFPATSQAINLGLAAAGSTFDIRGNRFENIDTGAAADDAAILLPRDVKLGDVNFVTNTGTPSFIKENVFDDRGSTVQKTAIRWYGAYDSNQVAYPDTASSGLFIEDNDFDGFLGAAIVLNRTAAVTVRRNTFGAQSVSRPGGADRAALEETIGGGDADPTPPMVLNYDKTANGRVLTWYPTQAVVTQQCTLEVSLDRPGVQATGSEWSQPENPVAVDVYYTGERTAEAYLGNLPEVRDRTVAEQPGGNLVETSLPMPRVHEVDDPSPGTETVPVLSVADLPVGKGYIRVQTQAPAWKGQAASSQFSRTVEVDIPARCNEPQLDLTVQGWTGVPSDADSYEEIMDSVDAGDEIEAGSHVSEDEPVYLTYTVKNTGPVALFDVAVRDDGTEDEVCAIEEILPGESKGCWRRLN
jgi:hypothetical protein